MERNPDELALIGDLVGNLDRPNQIDSIIAGVSSIVTSDDFASADLGTMFRVVLTLHDAETLDFRMFHSELSRTDGFTQEKSVALIREVTPHAGTGELAAEYATRVKQSSNLRRIRKLATEMRSTATDRADPLAIAREFAAKLQEFGQVATKENTEAVGIAAYRVVAALKEAVARDRSLGTPIGFHEFDATIGGVFPGELIVVAARPGIGKTAFALQVARYVAQSRRGGPAWFASLEMTKEELAQRCLCSIAEVDSSKVRTGMVSPGELQKLSEAADELQSVCLDVYAPPVATCSMIRAEARLSAARHGRLGAVVIDYLGLIRKERGDSRLELREHLSQSMKHLKAISKELACPVIVCVQLNRESVKQDRIGLHHMADSGDIERDANMIIALQPLREQNTSKLVVGMALADVIKNRNGPVGEFKLEWDAKTTTFRDEELHAVEWT